MFPTEENPLSKFKYASLEVNLAKDINNIERQTYHLLDWLGDCGGLLDALRFLGSLLACPISAFALQTKLVSMIISYLPSDKSYRKTLTGEEEKKSKFMKRISS